MIRTLLSTLLLLLSISVLSQPFALSEDAQISILTVGPGDNLYDKFGHSAIRILDEKSGYDAAYNYGVYDFDTPNFYGKFAQGKLNYKLEVWTFDSFFRSYQRQNRWVKEQVLNLSYAEKQALYRFLQNNAKPENKYYLYDFFYDNCATKIRDVLVEVLGDKLEYRADLAAEGLTFRQLIQKHVHWNSWGSMGMDVAIGAVVDQKANSWEYQFLPEYVAKAAEGAVLKTDDGEQSLVYSTEILFEAPGRPPVSNFFTSPLLLFLILAAIILVLTYSDKRNNLRNRRLDSFIFFVTGIIGVILALLWFGTDHTSTVYNYNLLWAFPFTVLFFLHIGKKAPKRWLRRYVIFLLLCLLLMAFHGVTGVQSFPLSIVPLVAALAARYLYINSYLKAEK